MQLQNKVLLLLIKAKPEQWKKKIDSKDLEKFISFQTLRWTRHHLTKSPNCPTFYICTSYQEKVAGDETWSSRRSSGSHQLVLKALFKNCKVGFGKKMNWEMGLVPLQDPLHTLQRKFVNYFKELDRDTKFHWEQETIKKKTLAWYLY